MIDWRGKGRDKKKKNKGISDIRCRNRCNILDSLWHSGPCDLKNGKSATTAAASGFGDAAFLLHRVFRRAGGFPVYQGERSSYGGRLRAVFRLLHPGLRRRGDGLLCWSRRDCSSGSHSFKWLLGWNLGRESQRTGEILIERNRKNTHGLPVCIFMHTRFCGNNITQKLEYT